MPLASKRQQLRGGLVTRRQIPLALGGGTQASINARRRRAGVLRLATAGGRWGGARVLWSWRRSASTGMA